MPVDTNTTPASKVRPRTSNTADQTPTFLAVLADRAAAWDGLLRLRVGNDRNARAAARTALRAAAHVLVPSLRDDDEGAREFAVRTLLARRRPASLHPRRPWARTVLVDALCAADRRDDDRAVRAAVASLAASGLLAERTIGGALARGLQKREASMRRGLDRLVAANMGLVRGAVSRYLAGRDAVLGLERVDLEQEATMGLLRGLRTFDPTRGFTVSTYVTGWIRQAISRAVADQAATVRAPVGLVETMSKINAARREYPGEDLDVVRLAALTGKSPARVRTALEQYPLTMSADTPMGATSDERDASPTFLDCLEDPTPWDYAEVIAEREMSAIARAEVARLSPREAHVLRTRYLSDEAGGETKATDAHASVAPPAYVEVDGVPTFESIGRALGVSRERVRQIEGNGLRVIRRRLGDDGRRTGEQAELFA
jgi:RNA polymerase sigma factor (sigma-70 family)